jgi:hypothetical protein
MRPLSFQSIRLAKGVIISLLLTSALTIVNNYDYRTERKVNFTAAAPVLSPGSKFPFGNVPMLNIKVHSNPNNGKFILKFDVPTTRDITIRITNKKGIEVYRQEHKKFWGFYLEEIDISSQPEGKYNLHVDYLHRTQTKTFAVYKGM